MAIHGGFEGKQKVAQPIRLRRAGKNLAHGQRTAVPDSLTADGDCHPACEQADRGVKVSRRGQPVGLGEIVDRPRRSGFYSSRGRTSSRTLRAGEERPDQDAQQDDGGHHQKGDRSVLRLNTEPGQNGSDLLAEPLLSLLEKGWGVAQGGVPLGAEDLLKLLTGKRGIGGVGTRVERLQQRGQSLRSVRQVRRLDAQVGENLRLMRRRRTSKESDRLLPGGRIAALGELHKGESAVHGRGIVVGFARRRGHGGQADQYNCERDQRRRLRPRPSTGLQGRSAGRADPGRSPRCGPAGRSRGG